MTKENGGIAIRKFLEHFENGEILRLADEIGIEDAIYDVCRQIGSGDCLLYTSDAADEL